MLFGFLTRSHIDPGPFITSIIWRPRHNKSWVHKQVLIQDNIWLGWEGPKGQGRELGPCSDADQGLGLVEDGVQSLPGLAWRVWCPGQIETLFPSKVCVFLPNSASIQNHRCLFLVFSSGIGSGCERSISDSTFSLLILNQPLCICPLTSWKALAKQHSLKNLITQQIFALWTKASSFVMPGQVKKRPSPGA